MARATLSLRGPNYRRAHAGIRTCSQGGLPVVVRIYAD